MATTNAFETSLEDHPHKSSSDHHAAHDAQNDTSRDESSTPDDPAAHENEKTEEEKAEENFRPSARLWIIIISLGVTMLLGALENTVVTVAAPEIVTALDMSVNYIWITNGFMTCR